ncbi:MAG TPA: mechanosensitive ion channel family protein [Bacilli bacterium]|nr:mechanosensitive ion channel family protein [Bacilli bacterium]
MKFLKAMSKKAKIRFFITGGVILLLVLVGTLVPIIFQGSDFAAIIDNSIGKFFNIWDFLKNNYVTLLESLAIVIFIWIVKVLLVFIVSLFMKKNHRSETLGRLIVSAITYAAVITAVFLILSAWGVQQATLLAAAGILGLAVSFGAQSLIEDIFAGLFIIFEKQFLVGDVIQVGNHRGIVREIGIRITKIEDVNGDVLIINNSDVRGTINTSINPSPAICEVSISYKEDIERVEKIIKDNLESIKKKIPEIIEGPYYYGVQKLGDSGITLRLYARSDELKRYAVMRAMNREIKILFDKHKIEIPFPQVVVHTAKDE